MKNFYDIKFSQRGFTLIELLVVVAIISLLSSIVFATLKDARDKAKSVVIRQEINELIKALELYRSDNNIYPYEDIDTTIMAGILVNGTEFVTPGNSLLSSYLVPKYLARLPKIITNSNTSPLAIAYKDNSGSPNLGNAINKCINDTETPKYVLLMNLNVNNNILNIKAVSDWQDGYNVDQGSGYGGNILTSKCFSFK